jgi:cytochrome b561
MLRSTHYTRTAIVLHWTIAALMIVNAGLALVADNLPDDWIRPTIDTHKSIGITVLGLVLLRLLWRIGHRPPPLPPTYPHWERIGAHAAHLALYVLMLGLPLSGWLHDSAWKDAATHPMQLFYLMPWPRIGWIANIEPPLKETLHTAFGAIHTKLGYCLYALLALHIAGALKHQFLDKEAELQRMWRWRSAGK